MNLEKTDIILIAVAILVAVGLSVSWVRYNELPCSHKECDPYVKSIQQHGSSKEIQQLLDLLEKRNGQLLVDDLSVLQEIDEIISKRIRAKINELNVEITKYKLEKKKAEEDLSKKSIKM